jgi:hypothetical protein
MRVNYANGVSNYYREHGAGYLNPHFEAVVHCIDSLLTTAQLPLPPDFTIVDIASGSGEAIVAVHRWCDKHLLPSPVSTAVDPFTKDAIHRRFPSIPIFELNFNEIGRGLLPGCYHLALSSFALHLAPRSQLFAVLSQLAIQARFLMIISPHKQPIIPDSGYGWRLIRQTYTGGSGRERARGRLFQSTYF